MTTIPTLPAPVETITLPMFVLPPEVRASLIDVAKAHQEKTKKSKEDFEERVKKRSNAAAARGGGGNEDHVRALSVDDPKLYHAYQGHWYALKMQPILASITTDAPKVTLLRSLITPEIQTAIEAQLTEIEATEVPLHPWTVQARERLGKMTPWVDTPELAPTATATKETKK